MGTYYAEADALAKAYRKALGWALQYGIKTYYESPGFPEKALGDLRDEIRAHEEAAGITKQRIRENALAAFASGWPMAA